MPIYILVDSSVVSNVIVADASFASSISGEHQSVAVQVGSEGMGDHWLGGVYVRDLPNKSLAVGDSLRLEVMANCSTSLSYQWKKNGSNISGATNALFEIASVVSGDAGNYSCMVSDGTNNLESNSSVVSVS
jgi:hypothetical protein